MTAEFIVPTQVTLSIDAAIRAKTLQNEMFKLLQNATGHDPIVVPHELISRLYAHLGNASMTHTDNATEINLLAAKLFVHENPDFMKD